jgi:phosphoenolpyruvate-protein kinase (PTS system EI component)
MAPSSLARVRRTVAGVECAEVEALAVECLKCSSADEVEELVREGLGRRWPNLFPPEILPPPKGKG